MAYTEEDKKAFKLKDMLNSRMSAIKAASLNNEGKGVPAKDMLAEANKYYTWLYPQVIDDVIMSHLHNEPVNTSLPTPTAAQQKVLTKIAAELKMDVETIKPKVLDFAEKNFSLRKYPENVDSVDTFVKALS